MKTIGPCGATCEVWLKSCVVLKRKLGLIVCNSCIMCMLRKIFEFNLAVNFLYFLSNWVNLLGIFTSFEKLRAFKRNPCFWNRYLMPWRWIIQLLWECWKIFLKFFRSKIWQKIEHTVNFKQWYNVFLVISEAWQGYESKAYGVLNHNLKLQCKKLSRTRDIPNFPTQGWADTAFCKCKRSETYIYLNSIRFHYLTKKKPCMFEVTHPGRWKVPHWKKKVCNM